MRPIALFGLLLLLPACAYVGDPTVGLGTQIGNTVSFKTNPNRPLPDSDTTRRVMGQDVTPDPLLPEPGNIWPGQPRPEPTLSDIQNMPENTAPLPAIRPAPVPTPAPLVPAPIVPLQPTPPAAAPSAAAPSPTIPPAGTIANGTVLQTGQGSAVITTGNNGIMTYTLPSGATGRVINNGNGTMTLIGTDGSVSSVPAPR